jgi:hypothetical protein
MKTNNAVDTAKLSLRLNALAAIKRSCGIEIPIISRPIQPIRRIRHKSVVSDASDRL